MASGAGWLQILGGARVGGGRGGSNRMISHILLCEEKKVLKGMPLKIFMADVFYIVMFFDCCRNSHMSHKMQTFVLVMYYTN
jgi:hypothetical protein